MKPRYDARFFVGILLVVFGLASLPMVMAPDSRLFEIGFGVAMGVAGLALLGLFATRRASWALPMSAGALAIGTIVVAEGIQPGQAGTWGGVLVLGLLGVAFLVLARFPSVRWWPIIPAGTLLTLGILVAVYGDAGAPNGSLFLAGIGATFLAVFIAPPNPVKRVWALITGAVLVVLALAASGLSGQAAGVAVAVALIVGGGWMLLRESRTAT
jgi:hypothetical protein